MSVNKSMAVVVMAVLFASSAFAAGDAARVAGDLKVDGIHFSVDGSVIRKLSDLSSLWTLLGSDIYYLGGNVGIGTVTPTQRLSVAGTIESTEGGIKFPDGTTQTTAGGATLGANTFTGPQTILTGGAANKGLIVKGAPGQTANLQEWQNSAGTAVAAISAFGDLTLTSTLNLPATTAFTGIIMSGADTLIHARGHQSFFAGAGAGNLGVSDDWNTAVGYRALASHSGGNANTAIGSSALYSNINGNSNTAVGFQALVLNTTGTSNTATGVAALQSNTGGISNVATGLNSLNKNTIGSDNVAYGNAALFANTTASYNSAFGGGALRSNTAGSGNTAVGYQAGYTTAPANANTTGSNNTFIGYNSGPGTSSQLTNATAIGYNALVSQSNSLVLGGTGSNAVKVGIGTQTPSEVLDIVGNVRVHDKDIYLRAGTDTNNGLGWYGAGKLFAGSSLDGPALYGFSGGALGTSSSGQNIALAWNSSGNVGIGTATPAERLDVVGTVKATTFSGSGASLTGLNAGNITGALAITQGGTGAITAPAALSSLGAAAASHNHNAVYQQKYARTAIVAREGGDFNNPVLAMTEALDEWCREPAEANPCLLRIMPGVYNIGTSSLVMQPYVDIEGSGEGVTKISGTINSEVAGVVVGASHAELRYLTVENAGAANVISIAIFNGNVSPKISHVIAKATASNVSEAVHNETSSPILQNVSLTTSGMMDCRGIMNIDSTSTITNVSITNDPACTGYGIHNRRFSATTSAQVSNLHAIFSGATTHNYGIYNEGGTVDIQDSHIAVIDDPYEGVVAIYNRSGTVRVANSTLEGWVDDIKAIPGVTYEGVHDYKNKYRTTATSILQPTSQDTTALVVRGHYQGSTANLQEWWDRENGIVLASISPAGDMTLPYGKLDVGSKLNIGSLTPSETTETLNVAGNLRLSRGTVITDTPIPAANLDLSGRVAKTGDTMTGALNLPTNGLTVGNTQLVASGGRVGIGKVPVSDLLDVNGTMRMNDNKIYLRGGSDTLHGVGWYVSDGFVTGSKDGPVVYGCGGGTLGSTCGGNRAALTWDNVGNVAAQGTLNVSSIPAGSTTNALCSSALGSGRIERCNTSSRKLKENITELSLGLDTVNRLRPVSFTWKANGNEDVGFIAEEVAALQPVLAIYNEQGEPDGVKYANMSAVLVKAVQEQQQEIERQKSRIESQGAMLEELKAELAELKAVMSR